MDKTYIMNRETGKIELHFEKSEYDALTNDQKQKIKSNYLWSRTAQAWVSRAKFPNLYSAKRVANELCFTEEEKIGERLSYAEQLERKSERAEARAERYEGYAANAEKRGDAMTGELDRFRGDTAFFTQPIIAGHAGSEAFGRSRARLFARYEKGMDEYRKSEYFRERANTAMRTANQAELKRPSYLNNRIRECNAAIRKLNKTLETYDKILEAFQNPTDDNASLRERYSEEKIRGYHDDSLERLEIQIDKLGFFMNCLEEIGGFRFSKENIKPGYVVEMQGLGKFTIVKANPTTVLAKSERGSVISFQYAEIVKVISDKEVQPKEETEAHPFQKDDILVWDPHGSGRYLAAYQVIAVTSKTVQMREIRMDESGKPQKDSFKESSKTIRRKPFVRAYDDEWYVCGSRDEGLKKIAEKEDGKHE